MGPIVGMWRPAGVSRATGSELRTDGGRVVVGTAEAMLVEAPVGAVEISSRVGSIPRRIGFPDGSVFETADNDGVDRLFLPRGRGLVHELERFRPRLFVFAALVLGLCFLIYRFAVPVLVEVAVAVTPPIVPQLMSQGALSSLDGTLLAESKLDAERQAKLRAAFEELAALSPRGGEGFSLNFREGGGIGPNAFALPDGSIILTDELVNLANDDDAVLGVLAHEIGHVEREHALRRLYRAAGIAALIMMIGGDIGSGAEDVLVQGSALLSLSYSRDQENEADRVSVELMSRAGKDPESIARFLEKIRDIAGDGPDFMSTHPGTEGRIEAVRRYARELAGD